jgi:hypothetical protein
LKLPGFMPHADIDIEYGHTSVAAHVQAETIPEAMSPGFTEREADENSSEFLGEKPVWRACIAVKPTMNALKNNPIPRRFQQLAENGLQGLKTYQRLTRLQDISVKLQSMEVETNSPTP